MKLNLVDTMGTPLATFEPMNSGMGSISIVALVVFIGGGIGTFILLKQKTSRESRNRSLLVAMLLFFVTMIALGTFIFNSLAAARVQTVVIYTDGLKLGKKFIDFADITNAYIDEARQTSFINPNIVQSKTQFLFVGVKSGKTYVLSSEHYPLQKVMEKMRNALDDWEKIEE